MEDAYSLVEFANILPQEPAVVLAEFAARVDDCARVDPGHPQMFYDIVVNFNI
jgi:hypothetical protein